MVFETWLAFIAASTAFLIFPIGPTMLLVITFGLFKWTTNCPGRCIWRCTG